MSAMEQLNLDFGAWSENRLYTTAEIEYQVTAALGTKYGVCTTLDVKCVFYNTRAAFNIDHCPTFRIEIPGLKWELKPVTAGGKSS
jgi:hypothetical protein